MALHLIKLCVGVENVRDLQNHEGAGPRRHTTRMVPQRRQELLDGGSLYWVIRGIVQCRQRLLDIETFNDANGISRCHLVLDPAVVLTHSQPRRPFQGWRYFSANDAPPDLSDQITEPLPEHLSRELRQLGLL